MAQPRTMINNFAPNDRTARVEHKPATPNPTQAKKNPRWVKDAPSYLDSIRATLAALSDEQKDAIHESLQE